MDNEFLNINLPYDTNNKCMQNNNEIINELYNKIFELYLALRQDKSDESKIELNNKRYAILYKIIQNISDFPTEEKFRMLKLSNKNIRLLYDDKAILNFLFFVGFDEIFIEETCLIFSNEDLNMLNIIKNYLALLETSFEGKICF